MSENTITSQIFEPVWWLENSDPFDSINWVKHDVVQKDWRDGRVTFEQRDVEFPDFWDMNAVTIVTTKYFRGAMNTPERETSLKQVIHRVARKYADAAVDFDYMNPDEAHRFLNELKYMLVHQIFSFNSPVWFNVGTPAPQQISACFLLGVEDSMESILNWYREEGLIFKGGSGAGINLSSLRSSKELLTSGGTSSGPVSFMRGADASAGTIKSGGANRRAAKMVILDVDHPDIEEFIELKAREEDKIRALRDAGFDMDLGGKDIVSVQYQNANNSVRVNDKFMIAVEMDDDFELVSRTTGEVIETVHAPSLFRKIAEAAWGCADPGVQYDGSIQKWHTAKNTGRNTTANPCSEYISIDNSSCNLASLNLMKFLDECGEFAIYHFIGSVNTIITAMDISISFGDFPTEAITNNTRDFRQLGLGYSNLGALLMSLGYAYDSEEGRQIAASITSLMSGTAYRQSTALAQRVGSYVGFELNKEPHLEVLDMHLAEALSFYRKINLTLSREISDYAVQQWSDAQRYARVSGLRNSQLSLLAPTGTISFMMGCDTTGIEPDFALVKHKKMVGGATMQIVNNSVTRALQTLGYSDEAIERIKEYVLENGTVVGSEVRQADYSVFDCAVGERSISPQGHILMMAAVQPFLSGAISKTVNIPESATVEDIEKIYMDSWKLGLKAVAVYRDNCKVGQPLSTKKAEATKVETQEVTREVIKEIEVFKPVRTRLPRVRDSRTVSFSVAGAEGYLTSSRYPDGTLGEVFVKMAKQGSTLAGILDAFSISMSLGLQHGVPLESYLDKFLNMKFEPAGVTNDPEIRMTSSVIDYVIRRLALDYLDRETREIYGVLSNQERAVDVINEVESIFESVETPLPAATSVTKVTQEIRLCPNCGVPMQRTGSCYGCSSCGRSEGCS